MPLLSTSIAVSSFMKLRALLSIPLGISSFFSTRLPIFATRQASTMTIEPAKLNVLNEPLQPLTNESHSTHPTGFFRDGYCWGSDQDPGKHYIGAVVTDQFLQFSKERGNDLTARRGGFPGLSEGCRWCLCVERWKEAMMASERLGPGVVPKIDLRATALGSLQRVSLDDLKRFQA